MLFRSTHFCSPLTIPLKTLIFICCQFCCQFVASFVAISGKLWGFVNQPKKNGLLLETAFLLGFPLI